MTNIGLYRQTRDFTAENAGSSEWCTAVKDGRNYFIKKFLTPVYPPKDMGLSEKSFQGRAKVFHEALDYRTELYRRLREKNADGLLVVPVEVITYQFHICTVSEFVTENIKPEQVHLLSEWQRLSLMRDLTHALINVHDAQVVHSDMKPSNVLIFQNPSTGDCLLRLIDFDGSFLADQPPEDSEDIAGDPAFYSPEAYRMGMDEDVVLDHRIDIFALGIIFHYYWCGKMPAVPSNKSVGVCSLMGLEIPLDNSLPLPLKQLISRMLTADPNKRMTLKQVDTVLGVQLKQFPAKLVKLATVEKKTDDGRAKSASVTPKPEEDISAKSVRYTVESRSTDGKTLYTTDISMPLNTSRTVSAPAIEGYKLQGPESIYIHVNNKGKVDSSADCFTYEMLALDVPPKKHRFRKLMIAALCLLLVHSLVMYICADNALMSGRYLDAKKYLDLIPFSSTIISPEYEKLETSLAGTELEINKSSDGTIANPDDVAYFTFTAPYEDEYFIQVTSPYASVLVYDEDWDEVKSSSSRSLDVSMKQGKTYHLAIKLENPHTGSFKIQIQRA